MQKFMCEMCGGSDLVKEDEFYVCQHCGTKYSAEQAKKLMVEGTVKIDNSEFVEKFLQNARRAKQKEDWEETEKYYNMVEQNDPTNIEAIFYSSYGKAKASLVDGDLYKRQAAFKVLTNCVSIIDDNFDVAKEEEERKIILQINDDIYKMITSEYVYNQRKNGYGIITWTDKNETIDLFFKLLCAFQESLENIAGKIPDDQKEKRVFYYTLAIKTIDWSLTKYSLTNPAQKREENTKLHTLIHEIDPSHEIPTPPAGQASGGCYVATAVYGSYDCPQVWTLRRYRDNTLAETWYGRAFIRTYYAISPTLVKWFGDTRWFKKLWQKKLDKMVSNLNENGVENTPYQDKEW